MGLAKAGAIQAAHLDAVVQNYLELLSNVAIEAGIPRMYFFSSMTVSNLRLGTHIYSHAGCSWNDMPKNLVWNTPFAAITPSALPAVRHEKGVSITNVPFTSSCSSVYDYSWNPADAPNLGTMLDSIQGAPWGYGEWYYMVPTHCILLSLFRTMSYFVPFSFS